MDQESRQEELLDLEAEIGDLKEEIFKFKQDEDETGSDHSDHIEKLEKKLASLALRAKSLEELIGKI